MTPDDKKIIIDEDWKAQVQREKEEAENLVEDEGEDDAAVESDPFQQLVSMLAGQGLFALGLIPQEGAKQVTVNLTEAKFVIDTLIALRTRTQGNLTTDEEGRMSQIVAELQRAYVTRAQQVQEAQLREAGIDLSQPSAR